MGTIKSSNLCTEIIEYSSPTETAVCNLASIALPRYVREKVWHLLDADLMGKSLTAFYVMQSMTRAIWVATARLLFYPLFVVCLHGPKWLKTEVPMVVLTFLLGFSNGYLTSVLMILTPKSVPLSESELSAIVMTGFLGFGLVGGSVLGWFWIL